MPILGLEDFDAIRKAIDVSLTAEALSDAVIALPIYAGQAELDVLARDANAETYEGVDAAKAQRVRNAAIFLAAARLAPAVPQIKSVALSRSRFDRTTFDPEKRAAELIGLADAQFAAYLEPEGAVLAVPVMVSCPGGRGL